jgi:hypothetical protein
MINALSQHSRTTPRAIDHLFAMASYGKRSEKTTPPATLSDINEHFIPGDSVNLRQATPSFPSPV